VWNLRTGREHAALLVAANRERDGHNKARDCGTYLQLTRGCGFGVVSIDGAAITSRSNLYHSTRHSDTDTSAPALVLTSAAVVLSMAGMVGCLAVLVPRCTEDLRFACVVLGGWKLGKIFNKQQNSSYDC
jgi:hypothetical protein